MSNARASCWEEVAGVGKSVIRFFLLFFLWFGCVGCWFSVLRFTVLRADPQFEAGEAVNAGPVSRTVSTKTRLWMEAM
jgi:hypothetical protein